MGGCELFGEFVVSRDTLYILEVMLMYKLQNGETYHPLDGYAQSMFANIIFAKSLAQRSIAAFSANPGS